MIILYNVGGLLDQFCTNCTRYSTEDAVRIGTFFIYNLNHTSLQSLTINYYAAARLHNYNPYMFVTTVIYSTLARIHSLRALHFNLYCTIAHKVS
jgi:DNA phosphorothioation-dependent restriction protein DptG